MTKRPSEDTEKKNEEEFPTEPLVLDYTNKEENLKKLERMIKQGTVGHTSGPADPYNTFVSGVFFASYWLLLLSIMTASFLWLFIYTNPHSITINTTRANCVTTYSFSLLNHTTEWKITDYPITCALSMFNNALDEDIQPKNENPEDIQYTEEEMGEEEWESENLSEFWCNEDKLEMGQLKKDNRDLTRQLKASLDNIEECKNHLTTTLKSNDELTTSFSDYKEKITKLVEMYERSTKLKGNFYLNYVASGLLMKLGINHEEIVLVNSALKAFKTGAVTKEEALNMAMKVVPKMTPDQQANVRKDQVFSEEVWKFVNLNEKDIDDMLRA